MVQSLGFGSLVDFGRFIISNITFVNTDCTNPYTLITVYDSVHAIGMSPSSTLATIDGYGDTVATVSYTHLLRVWSCNLI